MTNKITENVIENFCIELLEKQGYEYIYAPDIAPDSDNPLRSDFENPPATPDHLFGCHLFDNSLLPLR
ncbi:MAG: hypothetical protein U9Q61_03760 [Thermodesulfobacteriota bacterium]|nr:hypothetical protein [Thermodesulfobacteriota bacterium]